MSGRLELTETTDPPTLTGLEPELSSGITGHEPVLGGDLREWPSIVAHLLADQHQAQRKGNRVRVQVIRRLRDRIWREADEENWRRAQGDVLTEGVHLSRWRRTEKLDAYQRPVYDKIRDEIALDAMKLELGETRAALDQAETIGRTDLVREHGDAIGIIESYIAWWEERIGQSG